MSDNPNTLLEAEIEFADTGETATLELATLKRWQNFETYFTEDVCKIRAVTYSESPEMLDSVFADIDVDEMEVVVGDSTKDYRESLRGKEQLAARLERLQREERLQIVLPAINNNEVHSKLYILEHEDGTRTNIVGSPNLSKKAWKSTYQKNVIVVFYTDGGQRLDAVFEEWYEEMRDYGEVFMEDLTERVEELPEEKQEEEVHAWIAGRTTSESEEAEVEQALTERLDEANVRKATIIGNFEEEEADLTVSITEDEEESDVQISQTLQGYENVPNDWKDEFRSLDGSIEGSELRASPGAVSQHAKEKFGAPKMWFTDDDQLVLQTPDDLQLELMREVPDDPERVDAALEQLEEYFEAVDKFGKTAHPVAVKAQMFEAIIWFFWAPFANRYASVYKNRGIDLDKFLPSLYIYGEPGSGKGTLARYAFHMLSDGHVSEPEDGDKLNTTTLRSVRRVDSVFPVVFDDMNPSDIDTEAYLNFRQKHWTGDADFPALAFISNDNLPRSRIQHRAKTLYLDVQFEQTHKTAEYASKLTERSNPLFTWFTQEFRDRDIVIREEDDDTLAEARNVFADLYERAGRELPEYFPKRPAEEKYDLGKYLWQDAVDGNLVEFQRRNGKLVAKFDESLSVYSSVREYARSLPNEARASNDGHQVIIKEEDAVEDWFPFAINEGDRGFLSRILS